MARQARNSHTAGVYYVVQSGASLFLSDHDRQTFLGLLEQSKQVYNFKLYAYCLKESHRYHLVLYANGSDISKIMKSINIAYALYAKRAGSLFKDRYKSTLIDDEMGFKQVMEKVRTLYDGESCFHSDSMRCDLDNPFESACCHCFETMEDAEAYLLEALKERHLTLEALLKDKGQRNRMILELRRVCTLSLKDIGKLLGGLSESTVSKIIKKEYSQWM